MTRRPLGAQISHALKARGVNTIFGIPGVHNVEMYRGIEEAGITHVLARHEQGAGFMADGYARATGKPGVAYVISGPGLTNIMTPMGQAQSDSVPLLVVSSCLERKDLRMACARLHDMGDQEAAAAAVCGWSHTALDASSAYDLIDRAFGEFHAGRPGARHIQVPIDVLGDLADAAPPRPAPAVRAGPDATALAGVARLLNEARKPLFLIGGGACDARDPLRDIVDMLAAATVPTYAGKGTVPDNRPLSFGANLARPDSAALIAEADCFVVIGSELSETDLWRDHPGHRCSMIRVDIDPAMLASRFRAEISIQADVTAFCTALLPLLHQKASDWDVGRIRTARAAFRAETDAERPGIAPFIEAMMAAIPKTSLIVSDMTQFAYTAKELVDLAEPRRWFHPFGFGTLGYALPAAIGAKLGCPDAPVICIAGDYGFHYTLQELGTAVELGINLPIVLWDNHKLKEIEEAMIRSQIAPNAVQLQNPDFIALAKAFGADAKRIGTPAELAAGLTEALGTNGPTLLHVVPDA